MSVAKQPSVFKLNTTDDFQTWYAQFTNYATAVSIDPKNQFVALSSFLDTSAFTIVQNLEFAAGDKEDPIKFGPILERALKRKDKIPPRLALRYRVQESDESLAEFAFALEMLANKAGVAKPAKEELLVDSFCTGVRDTDLSIKLLEDSFDALSLALEQAQKIDGASKIRKYVRPTVPAADSNDTTGLEILATVPARRTPATDQSVAGPPANTNRLHPDFGISTYGTLPRNAPNPQSYQCEHVPPYSNRATNNNFGFANRTGFPQNPNRYNNRNSQKRCWYCNRSGHLIRNCRTKASDEAQNFQAGPSPRQ